MLFGLYLYNNESICHGYLNETVTETEPNKQV